MYFRHGIQISPSECSTNYYKTNTNGTTTNTALGVFTNDSSNNSFKIILDDGSGFALPQQNQALSISNTSSVIKANTSVSLDTAKVSITGNTLEIGSNTGLHLDRLSDGSLQLSAWNSSSQTYVTKFVFHST
jgi:hypothetical protein